MRRIDMEALAALSRVDDEALLALDETSGVEPRRESVGGDSSAHANEMVGCGRHASSHVHR